MCVMIIICLKQQTGQKQPYITNTCNKCGKQHADIDRGMLAVLNASGSADANDLIPCKAVEDFYKVSLIPSSYDAD